MVARERATTLPDSSADRRCAHAEQENGGRFWDGSRLCRTLDKQSNRIEAALRFAELRKELVLEKERRISYRGAESHLSYSCRTKQARAKHQPVDSGLER